MGKAYIGMEPQNPFYQEVRSKYTASSGQTLFTGLAYKPGYIDVYVNGSKLVDGTDFTALTGNSVTMSVALTAGDVVEIQTQVPTQIVDTLTHTTGVPRAELASNAGAGLVGYLPASTGAVVTDVQSKLREFVSVKDFGAVGDGVTDDTAAIQAAIDAGVCPVYFPEGVYKVVPARLVTDAYTAFHRAGLIMRSGMHLFGVRGKSILRIADNISTDALPQPHSMFYNDGVISDITFVDLVFDMNGQNNLISPNRATYTFNNWPQAAIYCSGIGKNMSNGLVKGCQFLNHAGVSCIVLAQDDTIGATLGENWIIEDNYFYNVGLDCNDHSSIFGWGKAVKVINNTFRNPSIPIQTTTQVGTGALGACEVHGSDQVFANNIVDNFASAVVLSINYTEPVIRRIVVSGNTSKTLSHFATAWAIPDATNSLMDVVISGNSSTILPGTVLSFTEKSFLNLHAPNQPNNVVITGNSCRSFDNDRDTFFVDVRMNSTQVVSGTNLVIVGNSGINMSAGVLFDFPAARDFGDVTIKDNHFALNNKTGGLPSFKNKDIAFDGAAMGVVNKLVTDVMPLNIYSNIDLLPSRVTMLNLPLTYEEGDFDFNIGDGTNNFTANGTTVATYTKTGEVINCIVNYSWLDKGSASAGFYCEAALLPYTVASGHETIAIASLRISGGSADTYAIRLIPGTRFARIVKNNNVPDALVSDMPSSGTLSVEFSYKRS